MADSTPPVYSTALKAALIAAVFLALWNAMETFQLSSLDRQRDPYMVAQQEERFAAVEQALPKTEIIGYVSDIDDGGPAALALFNTARYTLAPRMLVSDDKRDWVIGNFSKPPDFTALARDRNLRLVRDFGNGVALFRGAGK